MTFSIHKKDLEFRRRLERLPFAQKQRLVKRNALPSAPLHIVYLLANTSICGGAKIILEHAHHLSQQGLKVTLISHYPRPNWLPFEAHYMQISWDIDLALGIPSCDVIVATYWDQIQSCIDTHKAPVVYFEQGDFHLFDPTALTPEMKNYIDIQMSLPAFIMTVCDNTAKLIHTNYNKTANIIHNAVNSVIFNPNGPKYCATQPYLLMLGSDTLPFKGISEILTAFKLLKKQKVNLNLFWITPAFPTRDILESTTIFLHPSQEVISTLYRGAFAYICASHYEAFSLPVLEAMSCGTPVITTATTGTTDYAIDYINCLFTPINAPTALAQKILELYTSPTLKNNLVNSALKTASHYSWSSTIPKLITFYNEVASYQDAISLF